MNVRYLFMVAGLASQIGWGGQGADQTLRDKLAATSESYSIDATGSLDALLAVASQFKLPMGIEWIKVTRGENHLTRAWQGVAPSAILQDIVRAYPGYDLEFGNGVVHVFPTAMRGDQADILNSRIASFEVKDQFVAFAAYLLAGKVKPLMVPPDPKVRGGQGFSISSGSGDKKVTLALHDVTVRDALDSLCLSAGLNVWIVAYPQTPTKTRGGFLKTIPLHTSVQRDDDTFAPNWTFLEWGRKAVVRD